MHGSALEGFAQSHQTRQKPLRQRRNGYTRPESGAASGKLFMMPVTSIFGLGHGTFRETLVVPQLAAAYRMERN